MRIKVGLDVGAINCHIEFAAESGLHGSCTIPTAYDFESFRIHDLIGGRGNVGAIGISVAGDVHDNQVRSSQQLPHLIGTPLAQDFSRSFGGIPVVIIDNFTAMALGEHSLVKSPLVYIAWGDEVGVSIAFTEERVLTHPDLATIRRVSGMTIAERFGAKPNELQNGYWDLLLEEMSIEIHKISLTYPGLPIVLGGEMGLKQLGEMAFTKLQKRLRKLSAVPVTLQLPKHRVDSSIRGALVAVKRFVGF